jgi:hypothetical protein
MKMNRLQGDAILVLLIEELRSRGNWCGETHIQKATYFLQELLDLPTGFDFVLYKHGPFSFDLREELSAMRADRFIAMRFECPPYGPSFVPDVGADFLRTRFRRTLSRHKVNIEFIADRLGKKDVKQLERLATALYVARTMGFEEPQDSRAERVHSLKPHITVAQARSATAAVDEWKAEADSLLA